MNHLAANLEALSRLNPKIAERVAAAEPAPCEVGIAKDGAAWIESGGVAQCSRKAPLREALHLAESVDIIGAGLFVVLGFGAGHHLTELAQRVQRAGIILVLEPDMGLLRRALELTDFSAVFRSCVVYICDGTEGEGDLAAMYQGCESAFIAGVSLIRHAPSIERVAPVLARFMQTLENCTEAVRVMVYSSLMLPASDTKNRLANAHHYIKNRGVGLLKDLYAGSRAVVVSGGPSMASNLKHLNDEKCIIVAVQTVLKPLLAAGIRPHFVCALDHSELSLRFFEGVKATDVPHVALVVDSKVCPQVPEQWPGLVLVNHDATMERMLGDDLVRHRWVDGKPVAIQTGGTVAHLAYHLARFMGCDQVGLIGQDLGFPDGVYYGDGAAIHETWGPEFNEFYTPEMAEWERIKRASGMLMPAKDWDGNEMYTDAQMNNYRIQFERDWKADSDRGLTTYDCGGGVAKAYVTRKTLQEFLA